MQSVIVTVLIVMRSIIQNTSPLLKRLSVGSDDFATLALGEQIAVFQGCFWED